MAAVTFLGLGAMGSRMAGSLVKAGHDVTVWNRTADRAKALSDLGARVAATPRQAVAGCDFVVSMVRDDEASHFVWLDAQKGALGGIPARAIAIECSTLSLAHISKLAESFGQVSVPFLDAPVVGSRPQAELKQLIFLVGGDYPSFNRAKALLEDMGGALHHVGQTGAGATLKLAVNHLFATQVATLAEIIGFLRAAGCDAARCVDIIGNIPVCSPAAKGASGSMLSGAFAPMFPAELVEKDLRYVFASAAESGANMPMASATRTVMQTAIDRGFGADNLTGVVRLYT